MFTQRVWSQTTEDKYFYIVKENETATDILYRAELKPLYLDNGLGSVAHLQRDNQGFSIDLENLKAGQKIYFLKKRLSNAIEKGLLEINEKNEIIFTARSYILAAKAGGTNYPAPIEPPAPDHETAATSEQTTPEVQTDTQVLTASDEDQSLVIEKNSVVKFLLGTGYSRLDSTYSSNNSEAILLSDHLTDLQFSWEQVWSPLWGTALDIEMLSTPYRDSNQSSVSGRKKNTTRFSFGAMKKISPKTTLKGFVGNSENLFSTSYQAQTVTLETQQLLFLGAEARYKFLTQKNLNLFLAVGLSYYPVTESETYKINSGNDFSIKATITQQLKRFELIADFKYLVRSFSTSITEQKENLLLMSFGMGFPLEDSL